MIFLSLFKKKWKLIQEKEKEKKRYLFNGFVTLTNKLMSCVCSTGRAPTTYGHIYCPFHILNLILNKFIFFKIKFHFFTFSLFLLQILSKYFIVKTFSSCLLLRYWKWSALEKLSKYRTRTKTFLVFPCRQKTMWLRSQENL